MWAAKLCMLHVQTPSPNPVYMRNIRSRLNPNLIERVHVVSRQQPLSFTHPWPGYKIIKRRPRVTDKTSVSRVKTGGKTTQIFMSRVVAEGRERRHPLPCEGHQ